MGIRMMLLEPHLTPAFEGQTNWRVERPGAGLERSARRLAEEPSCRRQRPAFEGQNK
jgi:hypothetical protein